MRVGLERGGYRLQTIPASLRIPQQERAPAGPALVCRGCSTFLQMDARGKVTWPEKGRPRGSPGQLSAGQAEVGRQLAILPWTRLFAPPAHLLSRSDLSCGQP
jgi:hypothetical protein